VRSAPHRAEKRYEHVKAIGSLKDRGQVGAELYVETLLIVGEPVEDPLDQGEVCVSRRPEDSHTAANVLFARRPARPPARAPLMLVLVRVAEDQVELRLFDLPREKEGFNLELNKNSDRVGHVVLSNDVGRRHDASARAFGL
jgi:hypothetical protein